MVLIEAGTGGDEVTENDVLLEALQQIRLTEGGGLCEDACGILEGCGGDEGIRLEGSLRDTEQDGLAFRRATIHLHSERIDAVQSCGIHLIAPEQTGITGVLDANLTQHLGDDDLHVLIVDFHTLDAVDLLHLVDEVLLQLLLTADTEDLIGGL